MWSLLKSWRWLPLVWPTYSQMVNTLDSYQQSSLFCLQLSNSSANVSILHSIYKISLYEFHKDSVNEICRSSNYRIHTCLFYVIVGGVIPVIWAVNAERNYCHIEGHCKDQNGCPANNGNCMCVWLLFGIICHVTRFPFLFLMQY